MRAPYLACGVAGTSLGPEERRELERLEPGGLVVFGRNVASREQLRDLVAELRGLRWRPYVAVDLEGGRVNRLRDLVGPLPAPAEAAARGRDAVAALGVALGACCAHFGITVDFAPVADLSREGGWLSQEGRCLGATGRTVIDHAETMLTEIERFGVAGCLKHYPGLGSGTVDSHRELPAAGDEVRVDEAVFHELARPKRAVMVAHVVAAALGDALLPASLSPAIVRRLPRARVGPIIADDLEMGALEAYGSLGERAAAALLAGCDQVLVCNALDQRITVVEHVEAWAARSARLAAALEGRSDAAAEFGRDDPMSVTWAEVSESVQRAWAHVGEAQ